MRENQTAELIRNKLRSHKSRPGESIIQAFLFVCGILSILTTIGIVYELGKESWLFFGSSDVDLREFLTTNHLAAKDWRVWRSTH
jgi:phosphate transport system permease protein